MTTKSCIVSGEASETDSEEENNSNSKDKDSSAKIQGAIVTGEDFESELEDNLDFDHQEQHETTANNSNKSDDQYTSLLHHKLRESNASISRNLHQFWTSQVSESQSMLSNNVEQQLLKTQLTLQASLSALRVLTNNTVLIENKLNSVLVGTNYLSNLKSSSDRS